MEHQGPVLMESPQTHASKRSRGLGPYDEENHAPQPTYMSAARTKRGLCDDGQLFDKRTRHSDSMTTNICGDTTLDRNSALIDNNMFISSLNREYQQQLTKKSYELQELNQKYNNVVMLGSKMQNDCKRLDEENKLLKRAVNIQDNKLKQADEVNNQLQVILNQAIQRIQQLEESNNELKIALLSRLDTSNSFDNFMRGPPDVF